MIAIINDLHLGVKRQAGTTQESREALSRYMFNYFASLLDKTIELGANATAIAGDLFNKAKVGEVVLYKTFRILCDHLRKSGQDLILVRGNHDNRSETVTDMCSLELLYVLLQDARESGVFSGEVVLVYNEPEYFEVDGVELYVIPHLFNQEEFDRAVAGVPEGVPNLLIHANFDNYFAQGDHSLNLSKEQAKQITATGTRFLIAHEHHPRRPMENVIVLGNQFPSSIDDCLGDKQKWMWTLSASEAASHETWTPIGRYLSTDYQQLDQVPQGGVYEFLRVEGSCDKKEYAQVIRDVNTLRKNSMAYVVSNAVKIKDQGLDQRTKEELETIDIVSMFLEELSEKSRGKVKTCLND